MADVHSYIKRITRPPWRAVKRFYTEDYSYKASALSFISLLSLVPVISVLLYCFSNFTMLNDYIAFFENYIYSNFLPEVAGSVKIYLHQFFSQTKKLPLTGIFFSFLSAIIMLLTIDKTFHNIFSNDNKPPSMINRLMSWMIVLLLVFIIGMLAFISITFISFYTINQTPFVTLQVLNYVISSLLIASFYYYIPYGHVTWRDSIAGGVITAFLFEIGNKLFGFYIIHLATYKYIYGTLAIFPIFLLWVYISWCFILFGALLVCEKIRNRHESGKKVR